MSNELKFEHSGSFDGAIHLLCPRCGNDNTHVGLIFVEDPKKYIGSSSPIGTDYHEATIRMRCEDGCNFDIIIGHHKGYTYIGTPHEE